VLDGERLQLDGLDVAALFGAPDEGLRCSDSSSSMSWFCVKGCFVLSIRSSGSNKLRSVGSFFVSFQGDTPFWRRYKLVTLALPSRIPLVRRRRFAARTSGARRPTST
jgi:hypothetical protein